MADVTIDASVLNAGETRTARSLVWVSPTTGATVSGTTFGSGSVNR